MRSVPQAMFRFTTGEKADLNGAVLEAFDVAGEHWRPRSGSTAYASGSVRWVGCRRYRQRNTVERCINRLKQWHGLAMRVDKLAIAYQAARHVAAILIWTRH